MNLPKEFEELRNGLLKGFSIKQLATLSGRDLENPKDTMDEVYNCLLNAGSYKKAIENSFFLEKDPKREKMVKELAGIIWEK